jgi:2-methylcitrate dehydratase PrpD
MKSAAEKLGAFVATLDIDAVPPALVDKAKSHLLDTLGVACAGLSDPDARAVARVVQRWGGEPEATVIGSSAKLPAPKAAFVNALHARIHTFDDTHEAGLAHPGNAVVTAALAAAESAHASGRTLLAALLAGYEVATRVSAALGSTHYSAGFHGTGTATPFGAAAAAARACAHDAKRATATLTLAGGAAIGFRQYQDDGSMIDTALNGARGAEAGVAAAAFAAAGQSGPGGILDGRWGVLNVTQGDSASGVTDDLGRRWEFANTRAKPYASCRFTHGPLAALQAAKLDPGGIEAIEIATFRTSFEVSNRPKPRDRTEAILSHQLAAALAILGRQIVPDELQAPDEQVRALADLVRVRHDPALDALYPAKWPHRIAVWLRNGERVELVSDQPPSADSAQIRAKFHTLAAPVFGVSRTGAIVAAVDELPRTADVQSLVDLLVLEHAEAAA